jgi:glyoxylase-like metal-dependent hydrolase (beta-lactamase superfamily II)
VIGTELAPGLRRWTAFHPKWKREVGCTAVETSDGLVLIDPLIGEEEIPPPRHVLITVHWHVRSTAEIAARWPEMRVWATPRQGKPLRGHATATDLFLPGDALPGGIEALATARQAEVVFWLPEQRALVAGDVLLGAKDGGLRLCPGSWLQAGTTRDDLAESLQAVLALPVEMVLVAHGEPVLANAREALESALARNGVLANTKGR